LRGEYDVKKADTNSREDKEEIGSMMLDLVESNVHGLVQSTMANLLKSAPSVEDQRKVWKKNPAAYYNSLDKMLDKDQKIKAGGGGNISSKHLTINNISMNNLGLNEKQKVLKEIMGELSEIGQKMGYIDVEEVVVPAVTGRNRIEGSGGDISH